MADALKERFSLEPKLTPGSGGVFDVTQDGKLIFSKHKTGRFPEHAEIIKAIASQA